MSEPRRIVETRLWYAKTTSPRRINKFRVEGQQRHTIALSDWIDRIS